MNRQLVKSENGAVFIPELDFEIPAITQRGVFTTIEGLLEKAIENLSSTQEVRKRIDAEGAEAVEKFLDRLRAFREGRHYPFTLILDDPSGNSFLENLKAPQPDPQLKVRHYTRTKKQNEALGLYAESARMGMVEEEAEGEGEEQEQHADSASAAAAGAAAGGAGSSSSAAAAQQEGGGAAAVAAAGGAGEASSATSAAGGAGAGGAGGAASTEEEGGAEEEIDSSQFKLSSAQTVYGRGNDATHAPDEATSAAAFAAASAKSRAAESAEYFVQGSRAAEGAEFFGQGSGDGNVPGGWRKGGSLIHNSTESSSELQAARDKAQKDGGGKSIFHDTRATETAHELMRFTVDCTNCSAKGECRMIATDVPHFKEVIIMSFLCEECGWRNVEVKGGGAVPPEGSTFELRYDPSHPDAQMDMKRDVIKGDTAGLEVPELDLHISAGSMGGLYTTVEGLFNAIIEQLEKHDVLSNEGVDSVSMERKATYASFMGKLKEAKEGRLPFTLQLKDPMANSWIYSPFAPGPDPRLSHIHYKRSEEEDMELGLLDMKTEGYEQHSDGEKEEGSSATAGAAGGAGSA